ncbi:MAG: NADPH-dependent F420 reductase [Nocardioidaceae bacterium]|nr:NADPH-dependent F420 reductase [Nocardioidaceae bacterium]
MTTIGFIGAGHIGQAVAQRAVAHGYDVVLSNSRGPDTLADVVQALGGHASADTTEGAATRGDLVVVTIPLVAYPQVPVEPLAGKVVIDTNNYYPQRDGRIAELDEKRATSSGLLQAHLPESHVVKAFNHIQSRQIGEDAKPGDTEGRRALVVSGDDGAARRTVAELLDRFGFDVVDLGPLAESWRIEPGTPGYGARLDSAGLRDALAAAER